MVMMMTMSSSLLLSLFSLPPPLFWKCSFIFCNEANIDFHIGFDSMRWYCDRWTRYLELPRESCHQILFSYHSESLFMMIFIWVRELELFLNVKIKTMPQEKKNSRRQKKRKKDSTNNMTKTTTDVFYTFATRTVIRVYLVSWRFEPSQPQRIISGLKTSLSLSPSHFHSSH